MKWLIEIGDALMIASAIFFTAFVVGYATLANWHASLWGRAIMRLHATFAFALDYGVVARFTQPWPLSVLLWSRVVAYGLVSTIGAQQLYLMLWEQVISRRRRGVHRERS